MDKAAQPKEKQQKEKGKKQIPLRLSASMYEEIAAWAEDEFRSVNGQIEYLLNACIKQRRRSGKKAESSEKEERTGESGTDI